MPSSGHVRLGGFRRRRREKAVRRRGHAGDTPGDTPVDAPTGQASDADCAGPLPSPRHDRLGPKTGRHDDLLTAEESDKGERSPH